jgi:2-dehydropantoate 2-reductase
MNVVVVGAGAIGSVCAAKLSAGHDVTLVGRPAQVDAIRARGLELAGREPGVYRIDATTHVEALATGSLVVLATKVGDSREAMAPLVPLIDPSHTILCLQNGLYAEEIVRDLVGTRVPVLRAIVQYGAVMLGSGVVDYTVPGYILLESHERAPAIASAFSAAGIDGRLTPDMKREMWRKAIFNCVINPITAIVGCLVGGIADEGLMPLNRLVLNECVAVARADGVEFSEDLLPMIVQIYGRSTTVASMRQDLARGRRTEIDYLNGAVVALGRRVGIDCPVNEALTTIVKQLEAAALAGAAPPGLGTSR